jgi:hypothetical protein
MPDVPQSAALEFYKEVIDRAAVKLFAEPSLLIDDLFEDAAVRLRVGKAISESVSAAKRGVAIV